MKKKLFAMIVASSVFLAGCGNGNSVNNSDVQEINVCLASEPASLDPALNSTLDGGTICSHLFSGLAKWYKNESGQIKIVPDLANELVEGIENSDGTVTYTYTLRDGAKWSDGKEITASDFVFAWNRAASPELAANYCYMFEIIKGYDKIWEEDTNSTLKNPDAKLAVNAKDSKTLEVTLKNRIPYWNELLAFPSYFPVREDVVSNDTWATNPKTYISNGAYKMTRWNHNSVITLEKNKNYVDSDIINMDKINFYLSNDENNMLTNFQNKSWQFIDGVPTNEAASLKIQYPDEYFVEDSLGTYYICWNINRSILPTSSKLTGKEKIDAEAEIRRAFSLIIDRNYIVENITQNGEVPASSFVSMGVTDADGSQFYKNAGGNHNYAGYFDASPEAYENNWDNAIEILKKYYDYDDSLKKFTNIPSLTYLYNTGEGHKIIAENIQSIFLNIGCSLNLENQEWNTFIETRKIGDYDIARDGWIADYNDPICYLDMFTSNSGNNAIQFGKDKHAGLSVYSIDCTDLGIDFKVQNGTWAQTYDVLISKIKSCTDNTKRYALMHKAEDFLMQTGCITPIYFNSDVYMLSKNINGFFSTPIGLKYFMYCEINK